jgi:hypothetical protein
MKEGQISIVWQADGGFPEFSEVAILGHLPANSFSLAISPTARSGDALRFSFMEMRYLLLSQGSQPTKSEEISVKCFDG